MTRDLLEPNYRWVAAWAEWADLRDSYLPWLEALTGRLDQAEASRTLQ